MPMHLFFASIMKNALSHRFLLYFLHLFLHSFSGSAGSRMRQVIKARAERFIRINESLRDNRDISPTDLDFLKDCTKMSDSTLTHLGRKVKQKISMRIKFYSLFKPAILERINNVNSQEKQSCYIPSVDNFIQRFSWHYQQEESFRQSLIVQLLHASMAKMEGSTNPHYGAKVLNFMLALSACGNSKAFEFVSANFCSVSMRHIARVTAERRSEPFINVSKVDMVCRIKRTIENIRKKS